MQDQDPDLDLAWQATAILGSILPCVGPAELSGLRALLGEALLQWLVPDVNSGVPGVCARAAARSHEAAFDSGGAPGPRGGADGAALDLGVLRVRAHLALFLRALAARGTRLAPAEGAEELPGKGRLPCALRRCTGATGAPAREWGFRGSPACVSWRSSWTRVW